MYGYTVEQLKRKMKASTIIAALAAVILTVVMLFLDSSRDLDVSTISEVLKMILMLAGYIIGMFLAWAWALMAYALNIKKILKGIFIPIPILSACIEIVKGQIMAIKVIIFLIKNKNNVNG